MTDEKDIVRQITSERDSENDDELVASEPVARISHTQVVSALNTFLDRQMNSTFLFRKNAFAKFMG